MGKARAIVQADGMTIEKEIEKANTVDLYLLADAIVDCISAVQAITFPGGIYDFKNTVFRKLCERFPDLKESK